jgi:hypothetical protein
MAFDPWKYIEAPGIPAPTKPAAGSAIQSAREPWRQMATTGPAPAEQVLRHLLAITPMFAYHSSGAYPSNVIVVQPEALSATDKALLDAHRGAIFKMLAEREAPPPHSCRRCDLLYLGAKVLGVELPPLIAWNYPNKWAPRMVNIRPAKFYGARSQPLIQRDVSGRDPAMLPLVRNVVAVACAALGLDLTGVLSSTFRDLA